MGISSSTDENLEVVNLRSDQFQWETLKDPADMSEKNRVQLQPIAEAALERVMRDLYALFPPEKLGESSTDLPKEGDTERDEKVIARFCEFMKGGACKESFMPVVDCLEADEKNSICGAKMPKLIKCVDAHSDYYQPIISLAESTVEQMNKEIEALVKSEAAAKKPTC